MQQVRTWLADAVFTIDEEAEGAGTRRSTPTTMCRPAWRLMAEDVVFGTWIGRYCAVGSSRVTEDNLALDVRESPGKTAVRMALT
jgi:hypothetical protein